MIVKNSLLASAIIAATFALPATSFAGHVAGEPITATADITFNRPVVFTHMLTAESDLSSGKTAGDTLLAKGAIRFAEGSTSAMAITAGPNTELTDGQLTTKLTGKNDTAHTFSAVIANIVGGSFESNMLHPAGDGIPTPYLLQWPASSTGENNKIDYSIRTPYTGTQEIEPDTYTITTVAYAYIQ